MTKLYQFAVSHYCEKARWALDHKGINYSIVNVLPGPHIKQIKKIAPRTEVPVLCINNEVLQGSDQIIRYLDQEIGHNSLSARNTDEREAIEFWEKFADTQLGIPVRLYIYSESIDDPSLIVPIWTKDGPWYGKLFYALFYNKVCSVSKKRMFINEENANKAKLAIEKAFDQLNQALLGKEFLVGNRFTRADLAVCSLIAPLVVPEASYMSTYPAYPERIQAFRNQFSNHRAFEWVNQIYAQYRSPQPQLAFG